MSEAPSSLAAEAGYIPNAPLPDYRYMISVVKAFRGFFSDEFEHGALLATQTCSLIRRVI